MNAADTKPKSKAERETDEKTRRRAEEAAIVAGLREALDGDEQLLGFARGRLAGGIRGKLSLGPEAFFAPFVNVGLTERRLVQQHISAETGRPSEILPHYYALGDIAAMNFSDIETFGGESAARLTIRLKNDQHTRIRLRGQHNLENAQAVVEVFRSLVQARRPGTTPTQRVCGSCQHTMDQPFKFCPYCGQKQDLDASTAPAPFAAEEQERTYAPTPPGPTSPDFLDAVPYQDAASFRGPTIDDGLQFLAPEPSASMSAEETSSESGTFENERSERPADEQAEFVSETPETHVEEFNLEPPIPEPGEPTSSAGIEASFDTDTQTSVHSPLDTPFPEFAAESWDAFAPVAAPEEHSSTPEEVSARETLEAQHAPEMAQTTPSMADTEGTSAVHPTSFSGATNSALPTEAEAIGTHESAAFVTGADGPEITPVAIQDFEPFAPVTPMQATDLPAVPAMSYAPLVPPIVFPAPASPPTAEAISTPETPVPPEAASTAATPSEPSAATSPEPVAPTEGERLAQLLQELRGGESTAMPTPPKPERRDGPMSVNVHINRPRITVNETFTGLNAEEIVSKLKARVLPELNFGLRLLVSNMSGLRFAQEIVRRYNEAEKTNLPVPNSCWEFLQRAEEMGYVNITFTG